MPIEELIKILKMKFEEKSNAFSLEICKKELKEEMKIISLMLQNFEK